MGASGIDQTLVNELGTEIRIAQYPPDTSKYNPIEHRLFPHVSRVCQGVIFDSVQTVQHLMAWHGKARITDYLIHNPLVSYC